MFDSQLMRLLNPLKLKKGVNVCVFVVLWDRYETVSCLGGGGDLAGTPVAPDLTLTDTSQT